VLKQRQGKEEDKEKKKGSSLELGEQVSEPVLQVERGVGQPTEGYLR
jgi:hypothetical protein